MTRELYDCSSIRLPRKGPCVRVVIATHPATDDSPKVGQQRNGVVYELFVSTVLTPAMTANDLLDLYVHRGSFETVLADEDGEQDPDRWCSHTSCGQEFWQILSQWIWNLRLEFGQSCSPTPLRTTAFAEAHEPAPVSEPVGINQERPESQPVEVESSSGSQRSGVGQRTRLWLCTMGTTLVYRWFSGISLSGTTRWDAALPGGKGADPGRMPTRTCGVGAGVLFRMPG